jgi:NarL family two-component system sensor histidine kinase LiaS
VCGSNQAGQEARVNALNALRRRFATLRWRLMLSCFVAAFTAMMTLVVIFVLIPDLVSINMPLRPAVMAHDLKPLAQRVAPLYEQTPLNRSQMLAALSAYKEPILITESVTQNLRGSVAIVPGENAALFALGADGQVLAGLTPRPHSFPDLANIQQDSAARAVVGSALRGATQTDGLVQVSSGGQTVAAVPVLASGAAVGALLIAADLAQLVRPIYVANLLALAPTALLFAVIASIFGVIFGILTARGLTQRVKRLTLAAGAWSQGDFTASARDPSNDELGQLARDLNVMAERLQRLLRDQQRLAVVEERNRLARELHDAVKQQMFALTMLVGSAQLEVEQGSEAQRILSQAERIATSAQQEMTSLIQALRPVALTNRDLKSALREVCDEWSERQGIACALDVEGSLRMDPSAEEHIFRLTQEALSNVAKHSGATRVEIHVEEDNGELALRIRDNGHGFDVAAAESRGVGLSAMRERVASLGGTFRVTSSVGGTTIEARAPLHQPVAAASAASDSPGATGANT